MRRALSLAIFLLAVMLYGFDFPKEFGYFKRIKTMDYTVVVLENRYSSCSVRISYPVLEYLDEQKASKVNDLLRKKVEKLWESHKSELLHVLRQPDGSKISTGYELTFNINLLSRDFISITFHERVDTGGAHGNHYAYVFNYDLKEEREMKLKDLFEKGFDYKSLINRIIRGRIGKIPLENFRGIKDTDQFALTRWGLVIIFQPYEYTCFAYGFPVITIPYDMLEGLNQRMKWAIQEWRWLVRF